MKIINVIGLDVSKASVSLCLLTERPENVRDFYYKCKFEKLQANKIGITRLQEIKPDVAIFEPTGVNYSKLWLEHLTKLGCEIRLVGHKELKNYRSHHLALPDKDDDADSLALACYYFDYSQSPQRFVRIRTPVASRLRELVLRLQHLSRTQNPIINRIRQDLSWQFPEVALVDSQRGVSNDVPLLWGWIAGERKSPKYDRIYKDTVGVGMNNAVIYHAQRICSLEREEVEIEEEIANLLALREFKPYLKIFELFKFGSRTQSVLLSQLFPFENYLENNQPIIIIRPGRFSKGETKRHLSERRFLKTLGLAPSEYSSGDIKRQKVSGGSSLCRKQLWLWLFTSVEIKSRRTTPILRTLGEQVDTEKAAGKPIQLVRSRACAKAAKLLFRELVRAFCGEKC